jgi:ABC-2 type transport system ATP-binding protein
MPPARSAIVATGLRKSFGDKLVLDGVDLDVAEGTVFALLGPNGAGKTTIVHILSTLLPADAGTLRIAGHDPAVDGDAVRAAIGVTGQFAAVDGLLTGEENLILMADLHRLGRAEGRRRAAELLERFDLVDAGNRPAATYSGGMRRRLDIAMTLVGEPRIIFLDEPTARPGPAQPPHDVADHPRPRRGRRDGSADHAVPRRSRPPGRRPPRSQSART